MEATTASTHAELLMKAFASNWGKASLPISETHYSLMLSWSCHRVCPTAGVCTEDETACRARVYADTAVLRDAASAGSK
jgi:hypothetical protein